jgi:hypothetical protein
VLHVEVDEDHLVPQGAPDELVEVCLRIDCGRFGLKPPVGREGASCLEGGDQQERDQGEKEGRVEQSQGLDRDGGCLSKGAGPLAL